MAARVSVRTTNPAAERRERLIVSLVSVAIFLSLWELANRFAGLPRSMFTGPGEVFSVIFRLVSTGELFTHIGVTGGTFLLGYAISAAVGIILGLVLGAREDLEAVVGPYLTAMYSAPRVAFVSLLLAWFGFGLTTNVILVFLGAVFPIVLNTMAGVKLVYPVYLKVGRSFRASRWETFTKIILPFALPYIFTGLHLAVGRGLIGVVVGELFGARAGLGYFVTKAGFEFRPDNLLAGALVLAVISVLLSEGLRTLGQKLAPWQAETRL
jgi:NitT/TauT family transport system permease protein